MQPNNPNPYQQNQQAYPPPGGGYAPFNQGPFGFQTEVPGASTAYTCGIIGICLFFNIIGIVLNIVAIVNGNKAMSEFEMYPGRYREDSYHKARKGKKFGIIGLCLFPAVIILLILLFVIVDLLH